VQDATSPNKSYVARCGSLSALRDAPEKESYAAGCELGSQRVDGIALMKFPATQHELEAAGYVLKSKAHCLGRDCDVLIFWYQTPAGKMMPISQKLDEPGMLFESHFVSCKSAHQFRKEKLTK
jgi:hypothetical protein